MNSNNLLIDSDKQSINIIDMDKKEHDADYGNVLYALTNIDYFSTFTSSYDGNPMDEEAIGQALEDTIQITDKFIQAMKNKGVKFQNKDECPYEFFNCIRSLPFSYFCKTADYDLKWDKLEQMELVKS